MLIRHQIAPTEDDWKAVKRVFRYLKGTRELSIHYQDRSDILEAYSDASFADCKNSLTTSGYVVRLFGNPISWRTRKQPYVGLSTCQTEYVAMSDACQEMIALDNSIKLILDRSFAPMQVWCDNMSAISATKTGGGNKLRHMAVVKEHFVKQCVALGQVSVRWTPSKSQIADIFTKPLSFDLHKKFTDKLFNILCKIVFVCPGN